MLDLPPLPLSMGSLLAATDELTIREVSQPSIFMFGGNSQGVFERLRRGALEQPGVQSLTWDLTDLSTAPPSPPDIASRLRRAIGENDVQKKVLASIGTGAEVLGHGLIEFALSLGVLGQCVLQAWNAAGPSLGPVSPVLHLLDTIRGEHPATVLSLGELADDQRRFVWDSVLSWSRTADAHKNKMLVAAALDRRYRVDPLGDDEPVSRLLRSLRNGVRHGRVRWEWLSPLAADRLTNWVGPADLEVVQALLAMSGGDDFVAAKLWELWRRGGHVQLHDGVWRKTGNPEPFQQSIALSLQDRLGSVDVAQWDVRDARQVAEEALELAALGGSTFSRAAVAQAVTLGRDGLDRDAVEDLVDLLGDDDDGRWIVDTDNTFTHVNGERFWRYQFASPWIAQTLRATTEVRGALDSSLAPVPVIAARLWDTAAELHGLDAHFEDWLFGLATLSGDRQRIRFHEQRRSAAEDRRTHSARAIIYLSIPETDPVTLDDQVALIAELTSIRSLQLAIVLGRKVILDARAVGAEHQRAFAEINTGQALGWDGQHELAIRLLHSGTSRALKLHDATPQSSLYRLRLAIGLRDLGVGVRDAGRPREAVGPLRQSIGLVEGLVEQDPGSTVYRRELATAVDRLRSVAEHAGSE